MTLNTSYGNPTIIKYFDTSTLANAFRSERKRKQARWIVECIWVCLKSTYHRSSSGPWRLSIKKCPFIILNKEYQIFFNLIRNLDTRMPLVIALINSEGLLSIVAVSHLKCQELFPYRNYH